MAEPRADHDLETLLDYLRRSRGFDFTGYKRASLGRRIDKRMQVVGADSYLGYLDHLEVDPDHLHALVDAAAQTGPLVAGEVEPAAAAQVVEQELEVLVGLRLSHRSPPSRTATPTGGDRRPAARRWRGCPDPAAGCEPAGRPPGPRSPVPRSG